MRSIRKGNDVRNLEVLVSRLSVPVTNWDELLNLKVSCFERSRKNYLIAPDVVYKEDGKLRLFFEGNKLSEGVYDLLITFSITDPIMPDAVEDKAIDIQNIFRIVPTTAQEVDSQDPFSVDLNFAKDGLDYYHIWSQYHEGTIEDMFTWHRQPAADAAAEIRQQTNEFILESEQRIDGLIDEKTIEVDTLISESTSQVNALMDEMANHPTYIGQDHYVYIWNRDTQSYDKTDIYCKGDAFSISKVYASVAAMEADFAGTDTKTGDFVLIETGDNEDPDNSKLYVKTSTEWAYLTDLSGAIGFTGKTPQLSIGTVTTGAPGSPVTVTISEDGIDGEGNPKFKLNFAIPEGAPGKVMQFSAGDVTTGEPGSNAEVSLIDDGVDELGNPKTKLNFSIPRGDTGKSAYQDYFDNTTDDPKLSQAEWNALQAEMPSKELERQANEQTRIDNDNAREGKLNELKVATELNSHDISALHNTLTSLNANQESTITAEGYGTVSLPKNAANGGMGVKLEGLTEEVEGVVTHFEPTGRVRSVGKNLFDKSRRVNGYLIISTGILSPNDLFMTSDFIEVISSTAYRFQSTITTTYYYCAFYDANKIFISRVDGATSGNYNVTTPLNAKYIRFSAGITLVDIILLSKTHIASIYEPYTESNLYLQSPVLRSNGDVKDEIRRGSNGYELVKRVGVGSLGANVIIGGDFEEGLIGIRGDGFGSVSTWALNTINPISGTKDGRLSIITIATGGGRPMLNFPITGRVAGQLRKLSFSYKVNSGSPIISSINPYVEVSLNKTLSGSGEFIFYYIYSGTSNNIYIYTDGRTIWDLQIDSIKDELINIPDGATTSNAVTELSDGTIHYTLAEPIITPIPYAGLLNSNSNGTVYHEPVVADAGIYSNNITIQDTAHPIATLEKLIKREAGVEYLLDVSLAQIAPDGLSFTHSELEDGDLVLFTYYYNTEGPNGKLTASFYNSGVVRVDPVTGKAYKKDWTVNNGVITETLIEV